MPVNKATIAATGKLNMREPLHSRMPALIGGTLLLLAARVWAAEATFQYEPSVAKRVGYSQIVCSVTILETRKVGTRRIALEERNEYMAEAVVDIVFKGDPRSSLHRNLIRFRFNDQSATPTDYFGPPIASFRTGSRYLIFLNRGDDGLEVAVPVWRMEIELANRSVSADAPAFAATSGIAEEILHAVRTEPQTLGRTATQYFSWAEEVAGTPLDWSVPGSGKDLIPYVEPFLKSDDDYVRYQAAWWLSFRKLSDEVLAALESARGPSDIPDSARREAGRRLEDIRAGNWVPKSTS